MIFRILFSEDSSPESLEASPDIRRVSHPMTYADNPRHRRDRIQCYHSRLPDPLPAERCGKKSVLTMHKYSLAKRAESKSPLN